jgi:HSP20 family protein
MAMVKRDPLGELRTMQDEMNRLFNLSRARLCSEPLEDGFWQPPTDIYEDKDEIVVKMDLPEVDQEDIDVSLEDNRLVVQGERKLEGEERRQNYFRIERAYGPFRRSFALPADIDQDRIAAVCERGVLKIVLPKKESGEPRQIDVTP